MAYTAITGADKKAIEELIVAVPADEISALNKTDFPVGDVVALLHLDAVGDVNNVSWDKIWDTVKKADAHQVCLFESHASDEDSLDKATPSIQSREVAASHGGRSIATVIGAVAFIGSIIQWIVNQSWSDHQRRSEFTQVSVRDLRRNDPTFNYVICYTRHQVRFDGRPDVDFTLKMVSLPIWWGFGSITYHLYAFRSGTFQLLGDGGYLNWAYSGNVVSDSGGSQPRTVIFRSPI
ncbi:hypothetical protein BJ912DRAFT_959040 [Pholiota molesta]|nr:hypothetical protein BJ912DRAFT_959040 [Pholiota molesta]